MCKAFGAGADFVMLGGMLAGHEECAGEAGLRWKAFGYSILKDMEVYGIEVDEKP